MTRRLLAPGLLLALLCSLPVATSGQAPGTAPYLDPDLSPEQRAANLVSRMTLEEKVAQMQNSAPAIPRLGVPAYDWWNEALHGVARAGEATVFPQAIGLAATWDDGPDAPGWPTSSRRGPRQVQRGHRARTTTGATDGLTFWSPNINIFRDPALGPRPGDLRRGPVPDRPSGRRVHHGHAGRRSEVPQGRRHGQALRGAQRPGADAPHASTSRSSARDLDETYLPAFRAAIVEGKADSVMCAYNRVDGVPACASATLLQDRPARRMGLPGLRRLRLRRRARHLPGAPDDGDGRRGSGRRRVKAGTDLDVRRRVRRRRRSLMDAVDAGADLTSPRSTPRSSGCSPPVSSSACSIRPSASPTRASPTRSSTPPPIAPSHWKRRARPSSC